MQTPQYITFLAGLRSTDGAAEVSVSAIATDVVLFEKVMSGGDVCGEVQCCRLRFWRGNVGLKFNA